LPIDQQDIYFTSEYYELYERNGDGKALCFVFEQDEEIALYPFLINSVNELGYKLDDEYYDIQGAYGYNGVVASSYDIDFRKNFFDHFEKYCKNKNIIAEFIRYNPIIENQKFCYTSKPIYVLDNVLIDLQPDIEEIWMNSFDNGVRKAIKKGIRNNLLFENYYGNQMNKNLFDKFISIYYSTMTRNQANKYYFFSSNFFYNIKILLPNNSLFSFVKKDNEYISVELNFFHNLYAYGFIGGTLAEYYKFSPNSFLRFELIKILKGLGIKYYSIGGGQTKDDSKFKFKKSFSKKIDNKFYISKKIYNKIIYNEVVNQWRYKYPNSYNKNRNRILGYREIERC